MGEAQCKHLSRQLENVSAANEFARSPVALTYINWSEAFKQRVLDLKGAKCKRGIPPGTIWAPSAPDLTGAVYLSPDAARELTPELEAQATGFVIGGLEDRDIEGGCRGA